MLRLLMVLEDMYLRYHLHSSLVIKKILATRSDVVLEILVSDIRKTIEKFPVSFMVILYEDISVEKTPRQLKVVQECWRQSNHCGHEHYTKTPEVPVMSNLRNALIVPSPSDNDDLLLPQMPVPN